MKKQIKLKNTNQKISNFKNHKKFYKIFIFSTSVIRTLPIKNSNYILTQNENENLFVNRLKLKMLYKNNFKFLRIIKN